MLVDPMVFNEVEEPMNVEWQSDEDRDLEELMTAGFAEHIYGPEEQRAASSLSKDQHPSRCQGDEFVCRGCFLVKHSHQLTDRVGQLCCDCVNDGVLAGGDAMGRQVTV